VRVVKLISIIVFVVLSFFVLTTNTKASEGTVDLVGNNTECLGMSVATNTTSFTILMRCANLVYPPTPDTVYYYVWVTGTDGKTARLGDLDLGRALFKSSKPFSEMYVTTENQKNPSSPSSNIVMQGSIQPFVFSNITGQPTTTTTTTETTSNGEKTTDSQTSQETDEQSDSTNVLSNITSFLLRAGIIILVVVAIVGIILFVISKIR
jgi:hypothetical protein